MMAICKCKPSDGVLAGGNRIEDFGNVHASTARSKKDIFSRVAKINSLFGRLQNIWKNKTLGIETKIRLYEAIVLSTLRYGAETWNMTVVKRLEAAWQRRMLGVT